MITPNQKETFASDFDGTLVQCTGNERFLDYLETACGVSCDRQLFEDTGNWLAATKLTSVELGKHYTKMQQSPFYQPPDPMPGAQKAIKDLRQEFNLHIVTARSEESAHVTRQELQRHFGNGFLSTMFGAEGKKAAKVRQLGAFLFAEDSPDHAMQVVEVAYVILIPSPTTLDKPSSPRLILPEAHKLVADGMSDEDWQSVWLKTWQEIPYLVRDIHQKQTLVPVL